MADDKEAPLANKLLPSTLKSTDIPSIDRLFAYIAIQEAKGHIVGKADWDTMAALFDNQIKPKTLINSFSPIRAAAKQLIENKNLAGSDGSGTPKAKRGPKKRVATADPDNAEEGDADTTSAPATPKSSPKKPRKNAKSPTKSPTKKDAQNGASVENGVNGVNGAEASIKEEPKTTIGLSNEEL